MSETRKYNTAHEAEMTFIHKISHMCKLLGSTMESDVLFSGTHFHLILHRISTNFSRSSENADRRPLDEDKSDFLRFVYFLRQKFIENWTNAQLKRVK